MNARLYKLASLHVVALSMTLCAFGCSNSDGPGGTGGMAGMGGTGGMGGAAGMGGTGGMGGAGGMAGTGGAGMGCDDGTTADVNSPECTTCSTCAAAGACADEVAACENSQECLDLIDCAQACFDAGGDVNTCTDGCIATYPNGFELYGNSQACLLCTECPNNCAINGICTN